MAADTGPAEARDVGINAYIYLYPLVMMDLTRLRPPTSSPESSRAAGR